MYVKKFEAETLDEALNSVKKELGPDAIILKTVTNKGLKGAFRKGRIEITAAISDDSYAKKARVDKALGEQKEAFYRGPSNVINQSINDYSSRQANASTGFNDTSSGYGSMGLNKVVNTVSRASQKLKTSLDDFLTTDEADLQGHEEESFSEITYQEKREEQEEVLQPSIERGPSEYERRLKVQLDSQRKKIEILEKKLFELSQNSYLSTQRKEDDNNPALTELRESLRTLDLSEVIISQIIKKARFELGHEELRDEEIIFDLALRELSSMINTELAMFSTLDESEESSVTALISENSSGQSSMAMKLAVLIGNAKLIRLRSSNTMKLEHEFATSVFGIDVVSVETLSHLMTEARKGIEEGKKILLDIRIATDKEDESKKIINTLERSFKKLEIMINLSAIHSEVYNKKMLKKYKEKIDGVVITHIDQCLNYGALLNTHHKFNKTPLKFFGTGGSIPDDIESASAERILAGMFNL